MAAIQIENASTVRGNEPHALTANHRQVVLREHASEGISLGSVGGFDVDGRGVCGAHGAYLAVKAPVSTG
jgi:hypothetical protein